jgi:hypothetical protein
MRCCPMTVLRETKGSDPLNFSQGCILTSCPGDGVPARSGTLERRLFEEEIMSSHYQEKQRGQIP